MRRSAAQTLRFHSLNGTLWQHLVFGSWADASDRSRPDVSRDRRLRDNIATEKMFGHGQEDDVKWVAWKSFKFPWKIACLNNEEIQALSFA